MGDMKIVQMGSGRTALLLSPDQISERRRRPVMEAMPLDSDDESGKVKVNISNMMPVFDQLILCLVHSWDVKDDAGNAVPLTLDALLDLPGAEYDALRNAVQPFMNKVVPNFAVDTADDSPTEPSSESGESSLLEAETTPAAIPQPIGSAG